MSDSTQPTSTTSRPRVLAIGALVAAALGAILALGGFLRIPGVSTWLVIAGAVLLAAGLVMAILVLVGVRQGGRPFALGGIAVAVVGGVVAAFALTAALGTATPTAADRGESASPTTSSTRSPSPTTSSTPAPTPTTAPTPTEPSEDGEPTEPNPPSAADQAAYLAAVRPEFVAVMQEIEPSLSEDDVAQLFDDEALVLLGQSFLQAESVEGGLDAQREAFVSSLTESGASDQQAGRLFDAVSANARLYLAG